MEHCSAELQGLLSCDARFFDDELGVDLVVSIHDMYTARACDELAFAMAELVEGAEVIQVKTAGEWPGGLLLHAGVHRDDVVYDIEGAHEVDEWIGRWGRGMEIEVRFFDLDSDQETFQNTRSRQLAFETAQRLLEVPELSDARKSLLQL
jgi:hypothetical protein